MSYKIYKAHTKTKTSRHSILSFEFSTGTNYTIEIAVNSHLTLRCAVLSVYAQYNTIEPNYQNV